MRAVCVVFVFVSLLSQLVHGGWQLAWSDEFTSDAGLDTSRWNTFYPFEAVINGELEYYTPAAFKIEGGNLAIIQNNESIDTTIGTFKYTSGVITTQHKYAQTYGYFEMKAQVPQGRGFWPAFWMLPEAGKAGQVGEIDIVEMVMNLPDNVYTTYHCNYSTGGGFGHAHTTPNFTTGYHTFGLQWYVNNLIWYLDGMQVFNLTHTCIPNRPEYLLANVAIGGDWPAPPNASTPFPSKMSVDYIRAYKFVENGGVSLPGPGVGVSFTPQPDPLPLLDIWSPKASAELVAPGQTVILTVNIVVNSTTALEGLILQFPTKTIDAKLTSPELTGVDIPAGSPSTQTVSVVVRVPADLGKGWLKVGMGIFTSKWQSLFWEDNVWAIQFSD
eukprot:TRINITY_DN1490_c0_g1_i3.p1 TRINITY_DN1490_c0_g1~~TRINITY_DN1490_c0_g1_i3.p1  ORF type:complete len:385 (-),score=95.97 TRINITY_DN1490_c0_g1_i3:88-1242(-)